MNKKIVSTLCVVSILISSYEAGAAGGLATGTTTTATQDSQPTVNQGANQSSSGNGMAQALNYVTGGAEVVMGGMMIKAGSSSENWGEVAAGVLMVSMGLTNIAQGNEHGSAAGTADATGFATDGFGGLNPSGGTDSSNPYVSAAVKDPNYQAVGSTLKTLEAQGIYNPKTGAFTVGDKTYSASDLSSASNMAAAGIPQGAIAGAMAANAEAEKKALAKLEKVNPNIAAATKENGYEDGGGAGGGGSSGSSSSSGDPGMGGGRMAGTGLGKNSGRDPSSFSGMSKNYNGEPIGVAADSIFLMMSRRYKVKESQDSFFGAADLALQK
ncbi:MAG TPA: hypothetical protein VF412_10530 [Bdellovibrio sp.]|uniref:hypothetical protein n=1 Tax=Bdellovibrio sp. TaxID=28201 RepID=UPI002F230AF1